MDGIFVGPISFGVMRITNAIPARPEPVSPCARSKLAMTQREPARLSCGPAGKRGPYSTRAILARAHRANLGCRATGAEQRTVEEVIAHVLHPVPI
jgi:hypothetical protein